MNLGDRGFFKATDDNLKHKNFLRLNVYHHTSRRASAPRYVSRSYSYSYSGVMN